MTENLHGSHCYQADTLTCGWPEFHKCWEKDCKRTVRSGWAVCDDHAQKFTDRWEGIAAPEPQPELPRWQPAR